MSTDDIEYQYDKKENYMVMLVDDDTMVAEALRLMLDPEDDVEFHYCANPDQAVETAEHINPDVILLDMVMPDIDGVTVLRYLRANNETKDIPVVALSMKEEAELKAQVFLHGGNDYLIKLPDKIEMLARIRYHSQSYIRLLQRDEAYRALRVSQKKLSEMNLKLQKLATSDGLTGIPNRRQFDDAFSIEWRRSIREKSWLSLIMIDIDYFKACNDHYGHQVGDEVLKKVAHTLDDCILRPADLVARYGGEEFVVMLPDTDAHGASKMAERMRANVEQLKIENVDSEVSEHITVSIGIATTVPGNEMNLESLLKSADHALYQAKDEGRNRIIAAPVMKI